MTTFFIWLALMAVAGMLYEVFPDNLYTRALATACTLVAFAVLVADLAFWLHEIE